MNDKLSDFLKNITPQPGVYRMYDKNNTILYVGKAKNLKKRVLSYFTESKTSPKTKSLVTQIDHIEVTVTRSETEAFLLESNLIKSLLPKYNILMRDDKSYACLAVSKNHPFPRLYSLRSVKKTLEQNIFGPYPSAEAVRETLDLMQKVFKLRQCTDSFYSARTRPCLQYQIKRCTAPCVGYITQAAYQQNLNHAIDFLEGRSQKLLIDLVQEMEKASNRLDYEDAAKIRDQIKLLRQIQAQQGVTSQQGNADVIALALEQDFACILLVTVREGQVIRTERFFPTIPALDFETTDSDTHITDALLMAFIRHYYLDNPSRLPSTILLNTIDINKESIEQLLSHIKSSPVRIKQKPRGDESKWLAFANYNLQQLLQEKTHTQQLTNQRRLALAKLLGIDTPNFRMECFDISHTQGTNAVASCVVFDETGLNKSQYRRFNITHVQPGDDYAAMAQALQRRFQQKDAVKPEIVLIDGGKGQVAVALDILTNLGLTDIKLLGIAKGPGRKAGLEKLVFPDKNEIHLASNDSALHLLQLIRDEAHRFAITAHRKQRQKSEFSSSLTNIEGIGSKRRALLLKHFGGIQLLAAASVDDITQVPGISRSLAEKIFSHFH